jgi:Family of unknown function (DUF6518)
VTWRRTARLLAIALLFGVAAGLVKGPSGDGRGMVWEVRSALANISAPWVLIAWFAGSRSTRIGLGILLGLVSTVVALAGFYLVCGVVEAMGNDVVSSWIAWISANRVYFEAGVVSGPVFGALGAWWAARRSPSAGIVVGVVLVGEPLVLWLTGVLFPNGVLGSLVGLPLVVRIVPGFGLTGAEPVVLAVHGVEAVAGIAMLAAARRRRRASSPASASSA